MIVPHLMSGQAGDLWVWTACICGSGFAVLADIPINATMLYAWDSVLWEQQSPGDRQNKWQPRILGQCERAVVFVGILLAIPEVIAAWLVLKAAGTWNVFHAGRDASGAHVPIKGRQIFNLTLIGTTLSIGYGAVAAALTVCWIRNQYHVAAVAGGGMVVFHILIAYYIFRFRSIARMGWKLMRCRPMSGALYPDWVALVLWFAAVLAILALPYYSAWIRTWFRPLLRELGL